MANKRKRYNKGKRVDMRQGGRVALATGKLPKPITEPMPSIDELRNFDTDNTPAVIPPPQDFKKDPAPILPPDRPPRISDPRPIPMPDSNEPVSGFGTMPVDTTPAPLGDPRISTGGKGSFNKADLFDPATGELLTPEERKEQLEKLSYVAGRTPTTSIPQVQAGNIFPKVQQDLLEKTQQQIQTDREDLVRQAQTGPAGQPTRTPPSEQTARGYEVGDIETITLPNGDTQSVILVDAGPPPDWQPYNANQNQTETQTGSEGEETVTGGYGIGTAQTPSSAGFTGGRTPEEINAARAIIENAAQGTLPEGATIPQPAQVDTGISAQTMQMDPTRQAQATAVLDPGQRIGYDPSTGQAVTGTAPEGFDAGRYDATMVADQTPIIDAQTGEWSAEGIAGMQSQALTKAAQGIDFTDEQKSRGLTERVVGEMDAEAKMNAVKVAGTDLPRVLRAKKQLRRAGLTEEQINLIGNDPDLLEDELMDYTEEQRGMIAGLPDEALVSTQMNALLEGMESGEIPAFARPAVAAVNEMLAQRGLDASTVGRDALFNAIIQSAMPLAQSNAQSIKESVFSQRNIEAQAEQMNAQMAQQRAMTNSERVFNLNMAQFSADQQRALSNSKFLQTTSLTEVANDQQAAIQEAMSMAQLDLATLDSNTKLVAQNAQTMLQRDMANLNNRQQAEVLTSQMRQQGLLSDQAAQNASRQFNATSENQTNQFMASMAANMEQFNKTQQNAMEQFNVTQENQARAAEEAAELEVARLDAQLSTQIDQFNAQQEFAREQFNTQNAQAIEQSNVAWRRQANTVNTAAINAVNQQNAQNAFGLSTQAMSFLWQELRDQMDYSFKAWDNDQQRKASLMVAALGNEGASYEGKNWQSNLQGMTAIMNTFLNPGGG
jgi:hypothetical protein